MMLVLACELGKKIFSAISFFEIGYFFFHLILGKQISFYYSNDLKTKFKLKFC